MKEILEFINGNDELTVSDNIHGIKTVKWEIGIMVSFYLHISNEETGQYKCGGAIILKRNGMDRVEVINVSKLLHSEKEVINLIMDMISSSLDLREFIKNKTDYLNY